MAGGQGEQAAFVARDHVIGVPGFRQGKKKIVVRIGRAFHIREPADHFGELLQFIHQPTFASGVAWPHFLNSYRQIDPVSQAVSEFNTTVILPDFTISSHIY